MTLTIRGVGVRAKALARLLAQAERRKVRNVMRFVSP
jgi:hypothetical protein